MFGMNDSSRFELIAFLLLLACTSLFLFIYLWESTFLLVFLLCTILQIGTISPFQSIYLASTTVFLLVEILMTLLNLSLTGFFILYIFFTFFGMTGTSLYKIDSNIMILDLDCSGTKFRIN